MSAPRPGSERVLIVLLRVGGVLTLTALVAVFLPVEWMVRIHEWLGLGAYPTPQKPIVDYLTRSLSALYAYHGGLLLLMSTDVRRYRTLVVYVAAANVVLGALLWGIDIHAGMPPAWTYSEGPWMLVIGAVIWWLASRLPQTAE